MAKAVLCRACKTVEWPEEMACRRKDAKTTAMTGLFLASQVRKGQSKTKQNGKKQSQSYQCCHNGPWLAQLALYLSLYWTVIDNGPI